MSGARASLLSLSGPALAFAIASAVVGGAMMAILDQTTGGVIELSLTPIDLTVLVRTVLVSLGIGVLAALLALPGAWLMRSLSPRWVLLGLAPMLLPVYLVHAAWSLARAPGTLLGDTLEGGSPALWHWANLTQATLSLALWSWPIAMLVIGARATRIDQAALDALRLERAGLVARLRVVVGALAPAIAGAIGIVALLMLGSAIPLHVAQIDTYAIVVWRQLAQSPSPSGAWISALPLLGIAIAGGWLLAGRLLATRAAVPFTHEQHRSPASRGLVVLAGLIWSVSILVPLGLLVRSAPPGPAWNKFIALEGESIGLSALLALIAGAGALVIASSTALGLTSAERSLQRRAHGLALRLWIVLALVPGVLVGSSLASLAGIESLSWITQTSTGVVIATLARFGAVAALAGWWLAQSEPAPFRDLRALHADAPVRAWWHASAPLQAGGLVGAALAVGLLAFHEIEATVVVAPAGTPALSQRLLSLLHYLRDDQLAVGVVLITSAGLFVAFLAALATGRTIAVLRRMAPVVAIVLMASIVPACGEGGDASSLPDRALGALGTAPGEFVTPRAIDAGRDLLWVIDKTGRVQGLRPDGESVHSWIMPATDRGKPTGVTLGPDGLIYVADTHENRISVFEPTVDGGATLVRAWGEYGQGPGQFVFPTDVAIVADHLGVIRRIFVGEFGGNDRVSAFGADGEFLFSFGAPGYDPDPRAIRFSRPQSIMHLPESDELIVADAANHRLGRFTIDGEILEWIGAKGGMPGREPEQFSYPYGLAHLDDGTILVTEYGSNRVQHLDLTRAPGSRTLAILGGPGRDLGQFVTPWGAAVHGDEIFVLDSGNHRIQVFSAPRARSSRASLARSWATDHPEGAR